MLYTPWNSVYFVVLASLFNDTSVAELCCHKTVDSADITLHKVRNVDGFFDGNCVTSI